VRESAPEREREREGEGGREEGREGEGEGGEREYVYTRKETCTHIHARSTHIHARIHTNHLDNTCLYKIIMYYIDVYTHKDTRPHITHARINTTHLGSKPWLCIHSECKLEIHNHLGSKPRTFITTASCRCKHLHGKK
jgi:hypothetical protein